MPRRSRSKTASAASSPSQAWSLARSVLVDFGLEEPDFRLGTSGGLLDPGKQASCGDSARRKVTGPPSSCPPPLVIPVEREASNVQEAITPTRFITVAQDSAPGDLDAYANQYWRAPEYFIDAQSRVRYVDFLAARPIRRRRERAIRDLLATVAAAEAEGQRDQGQAVAPSQTVTTPETTRRARAERFTDAMLLPGSHDFTAPATLPTRFANRGSWKFALDFDHPEADIVARPEQLRGAARLPGASGLARAQGPGPARRPPDRRRRRRCELENGAVTVGPGSGSTASSTCPRSATTSSP